jgi:hypothetical protein
MRNGSEGGMAREGDLGHSGSSIAGTVFRLLGRGLLRVVVVFSVLIKAGSGEANGFMDIPAKPSLPPPEYRP